MPILIALDGVDDAPAELEVELDELLLLPPQAAIHSPHMAATATTVTDRGSRCPILLKLVTS